MLGAELNEQGTVKRNSAVPVPLFREQWNREQLISDMTEQEQVQEQYYSVDREQDCSWNSEHGTGLFLGQYCSRNSEHGTGLFQDFKIVENKLN